VTVVKKLITELPPEQFEEAINNFIEREATGCDELEASTFFVLLEEIDKERKKEVLEVEGQIVDGQLHLTLQNSPLSDVDVHENEIELSNVKIVVHFKDAEQLPAASKMNNLQ